MLPKLHAEMEKGSTPLLQKRAGEEDVSRRGAFAFGIVLRFTVRVPRRLGVSAAVMRLWRDGDEAADYPFSFSSSTRGADEYTLTLSLDASLCGDTHALLYYELLLLRGGETLFSRSVNNVDFVLDDHSAAPFRLLVYRSDFEVPAWFAGGTMYHVFVDRFCRGKNTPYTRPDASFNADWEHGIPQYPDRAGADFSNNEFFGGDLIGVRNKLDYLASLGVTVIYLSPIFKAYSNHKYDTGDYEQVDEAFGGNEALWRLIEAAREKGIRILLDGVFNHTGDDSRYFNRYGKYASLGAYESKESPYFPWYCFHEHPHSYECWWGIRILPKLNPACKACREYFVGEDGIIARYLKRGIGGWRLDVADELSDEFLDELRAVAKKTDADALILGEVWENAADKMAYGKRRRYFRGTQLDSVMNYPLRNAILSFVLEGNAESFYNTVTDLYSSYPPFVCDALMNLLGTHDTARILSVLGEAPFAEMSQDAVAAYRLPPHKLTEARQRLKLASLLQFTVRGVPSVYYGDEVGLEGGHDPFCRMPYPWGREDKELQEHYRFLGDLRREHGVFEHGEMCFLTHRPYFLAYTREDERERLLFLINSGACEQSLPLSSEYVNVVTGQCVVQAVTVAPMRFVILRDRAKDFKNGC